MLELDENFRIEPDVHNFTLKYRKEILDKDGNKRISKRDWYCPTMKRALELYLNETLRLEVIASATATEILERIKEVENKIK